MELKVKIVDASRWNTRGHGERLLYTILEERLTYDDVNISHVMLPTWEEHQDFIHRYCSGDKSHPYKKWYIIKIFRKMIGHCYITRQNEIGICILKEYWGKGYGPAAVRALILREPESYYLANIHPENKKSRDLFKKFGFSLVQHTYKLTIAEAQPLIENQVEWKMLPDRPNTGQ